MLFNKNAFHKANDKKVLHKVHKNWVIMSSALLLAVTGGMALAANTSANADSTTPNGNQSATVQSVASGQTNQSAKAQLVSDGTDVSPAVSAQATSLEADPVQSAPASSVVSKASSLTASSSAAPVPSLAKTSYLNGNNGSAASEHARDNYEKATENYYKPVVHHYVQSLNSMFPAQTKRLSNNLRSAQAKQTNDAKSAQAYEAMATKSGHNQAVSSLAAKANMTTSAYIDSVVYRTSAYNTRLSGGSDLIKTESTADSYARVISTIDNNSVVSASYHNAYELASANAQAAAVQASADDIVAKGETQNSAANASALASAKTESGVYALKTRIANIYSSADAYTVRSMAQKDGFNTNSSATSSVVSSVADNFNPAESSGVFNVPLSNGGFSAVSYKQSDEYYQLLSDTSAMNVASAVEARDDNIISADSVALSSDTVAVSIADSNALSADDYAKSANASASSLYVLGNNPTLNDIFGGDAVRGDKALTGRLNGIANLDRGEAGESAKSEYQAIVNDASKHPANKAVDEAKLNELIKGINGLNGVNARRNNQIKAIQYQYQALISDAGKHPANKAEDLAKVKGLMNEYSTTVKRYLANNTKNEANDLFSADGVKTGLINTPNDAAYDRLAEYFNNVGNDHKAIASAVAGVDNAVKNDARSYAAVSSASASYANGIDAEVTLASYYASSFANDSSADAKAVSSASADLNSFYKGNMDAKTARAFNAYNSASAAEPNDATLAHAFGVNVFNHSPRFITTQKNALLHSNTIFSAKNKLARVPVGTQLTVDGVAFDNIGTTRYTIDYNGTKGYITANPYFVKNTYAEAGKIYSVAIGKKVLVHSSVNFGADNDKVTGSLAPTVSPNARITARAVHADNDEYGVTRLQLNNGGFISSNRGLVSFIPVNATENNGAKASQSSVSDDQLVTFSDELGSSSANSNVDSSANSSANSSSASASNGVNVDFANVSHSVANKANNLINK